MESVVAFRTFKRQRIYRTRLKRRCTSLRCSSTPSHQNRCSPSKKSHSHTSTTRFQFPTNPSRSKTASRCSWTTSRTSSRWRTRTTTQVSSRSFSWSGWATQQTYAAKLTDKNRSSLTLSGLWLPSSPQMKRTSAREEKSSKTSVFLIESSVRLPHLSTGLGTKLRTNCESSALR